MTAIRRALPWAEVPELPDLAGRPLTDEEAARVALAGLVALAERTAGADESAASPGLPGWAVPAAAPNVLEVFDEIYGVPKVRHRRRSRYRLRSSRHRGTLPPRRPFVIRQFPLDCLDWLHERPYDDG